LSLKSTRCGILSGVGETVNIIERSKRRGGDHSSRPAQVVARENEQKALALWVKGATFQQIAAAGFGITSASGAWRATRRALARIPKAEADEARQAQLARLQALRMMVWNSSGSDPIRAAEALLKIEAREARLLGLDLPPRIEASSTDDSPRIQLEFVRELIAEAEREDREALRAPGDG
jgi:hypothetical protein